MNEPSFRLDGRLALVSGAGRGIGRGCALALAGAGAEVIALSRTAPELEALVGEIETAGGRARALVCDVTDTAAVRSAIEGPGRIGEDGISIVVGGRVARGQYH